MICLDVEREMPNNLKTEVDHNYDFFQRNLSTFLSDHAGQYVLLKDRSVIDFYDGPGDAYRAGLEQYPDEIFSIQEVTDQPVDLGFMSLALA
jgi:hypothetical protein